MNVVTRHDRPQGFVYTMADLIFSYFRGGDDHKLGFKVERVTGEPTTDEDLKAVEEVTKFLVEPTLNVMPV